MRVVVQRVLKASCEVNGKIVGKINNGFMLLVGFTNGDDIKNIDEMVKKILSLRIMDDENGVMNKNILDTGGSILSISQFTLYADCSSRRPGFTDAARPEISEPLYELVVSECRKRGFEVGTGHFGADMKVESINDGPVTILLDTKDFMK